MAETTLRIRKKNEDEELSQELFLRAGQKTKIRNAFANNMLIDLKLSKAQLSKVIQSGEFFGALLGKLAVTLVKVVIPLAKTISGPLSTMVSASAKDGAIQGKMHGTGVA